METVGNRRYVIETSELIARFFDGYLAGLRYGKTMAQVDAHYGGLLREIKEMQNILAGRKPHSAEREEG